MSSSAKKKQSSSVLSDSPARTHSQRYPPSTPPLPLRSLQLVARQPQTPVVLRERRKVKGQGSAVRESWPRASATSYQRSLTPPSRAHSVAETRHRPSSQPTSAIVSLPPTASVSQNPLLPGASFHRSSNLLAIDGKIEQAMDLVKSHLMLVVREEVKLLRERLRELQEKNQQLERENNILRALTHNIYSTTGPTAS
ncbi:TSC22 domain family protein 4 isoform X2 [Fundulus heteroclitus]|uniref:TSC22 domain family protein 4 isoform X2 n=1 Tax=Fundulus heteroclitus TaxID=8078 RepID=UPI00165C2D4D|nr:TSC22 domain family protein 4 isoform X2 [Fundulus heteroclitus]